MVPYAQTMIVNYIHTFQNAMFAKESTCVNLPDEEKLWSSTIKKKALERHVWVSAGTECSLNKWWWCQGCKKHVIQQRK